MLDAAFKLEPDAKLVIAGFSSPAFSGLGESRNRRTHMCLPDQGPIPVGTYHVIDRQTVWYRIDKNKKSDWFSLYAKDRVIDDERYCDGVTRGQFRLHPKSGGGISRGCITLDLASDFALLRRMFEATETQLIPGTEWMSYGTVVVS
jgi:Protein of unknown function (DUF2778)